MERPVHITNLGMTQEDPESQVTGLTEAQRQPLLNRESNPWDFLHAAV